MVKTAGSDNSGVAMLVVLIVGVVIMVFCLSLLLVTYTLFSQSSRKMTQQQCKILAQSVSEAIGEELKKPDSELCIFLKKQMDSGYWVSEETLKDFEEDTQPVNMVSELELRLDAGASTGDYSVIVFLSYSLNLADDDGSDEGNEDDDQDDNPKGDESANVSNIANNAESSGEENSTSGNNSYSIRLTVKCVRGDASDKDVQSYTIETIYPAVSMKTDSQGE